MEKYSDNTEVIPRSAVLEEICGIYDGTQGLSLDEASQILSNKLDLGEELDLSAIHSALRLKLSSKELDIYEDKALLTSLEAIQQAVSLIEKFPWLQTGTQAQRTFSAYKLEQMAGNHAFDDYPLLYGLSEPESHEVRYSINELKEDKPLPGESLYDARYRTINERFGLSLPGRSK